MMRQRQLAIQQSGGTLRPGDMFGLPAGISVYSPDGGHGIKQELIQIPQLSSSTSSPDSSPSPGTVLHGHHGHGGHHQIAIISANTANSNNNSSSNNNNNHTPPPLAIVSPPTSWSSVGNGSSNGNGATSGSPSTAHPGAPPPTPTTPSNHHHHLNHLNQNHHPLSTTSTTQLTPLALSGSSGGASRDKIPAMVREIQCSMPDDKEWQSQLFGLLNNQTYNQCEVDLFELMCKVIDQSLFAQVDWARNSIYFKDLKVSFISFLSPCL